MSIKTKLLFPSWFKVMCQNCNSGAAIGITDDGHVSFLCTACKKTEVTGVTEDALD